MISSTQKLDRYNFCIDRNMNQRIASYFMESDAKQVTDLLKEFGIRASFQQNSRSIKEEPFVEHRYDVIVEFIHIDEWNCATRILKSRSNC